MILKKNVKDLKKKMIITETNFSSCVLSNFLTRGKPGWKFWGEVVMMMVHLLVQKTLLQRQIFNSLQWFGAAKKFADDSKDLGW